MNNYIDELRELAKLKDEGIIHAMKRLAFKTPNQVFFGESYNVALTT